MKRLFCIERQPRIYSVMDRTLSYKLRVKIKRVPVLQTRWAQRVFFPVKIVREPSVCFRMPEVTDALTLALPQYLLITTPAEAKTAPTPQLSLPEIKSEKHIASKTWYLYVPGYHLRNSTHALKL